MCKNEKELSELGCKVIKKGKKGILFIVKSSNLSANKPFDVMKCSAGTHVNN